MNVTKNKVVSIDYTLTGDDGKVIDSSAGGEPLEYLHGAGNIIPGLEAALEGKAVGDAVKATIAPHLAYGLTNVEMIQPVPRAQFPGITDITVGTQFQAQTAQGPRVVTVVAVEDETVTVDANHPLAGKTLHFDVNIMDIRDASPEEIQHGHVYGPDGHEH